MTHRGLWALVLVGFLLRVWGLDFGLPNDSRPDELPNSAVVIENVLTPLLHGDFRLNPRTFNYPSVFYYVMSVLYLLQYLWGVLTGSYSGWISFWTAYQTDVTPFHLTMRWLSVVCGVCTIPLMVLLGRRMGGNGIGWLSGLLMTTCYVVIRNNHFGTVDSLWLLGMTAALWALVRFYQERTSAANHLACLLVGLATGIKYPAALLLLAFWMALGYLYRPSQTGQWWVFFRECLWVAVRVTAVFLLTSPWIVLDFGNFQSSLGYEAYHYFQTGLEGMEGGWVFYPKFALFYGLGPAVFLLSLWGIVRVVRNRPEPVHFVLLSFLVASYLLLGVNARVMTRYCLPLVPVLLVYAAYAIQYLAQLVQTVLERHDLYLGRYHRWAGLTAVLVVALYFPVGQALQLDYLLAQTDTREMAREWIIRNAEPKSIVATGPRLGRLLLPPQYQTLVVESSFSLNKQPGPIQLISSHPDKRYEVLSSYGEPGRLRQAGVRFVVMYFSELPLFSNARWAFERLMKEAGMAVQWNSLKPNARKVERSRMDQMDAFFLPYVYFEDFECPGPQVVIFDLTQPPPVNAIQPDAVSSDGSAS